MATPAHRTRLLRPHDHPTTSTSRTPRRRVVRQKHQYPTFTTCHKHLSRFARNQADNVHIVTELTAHKVTFVSAARNVDAIPVGQLTHGLLAAVNEYRSAREDADIADNGRKGHTRWHSRTRPSAVDTN
ncbi:recombinase family protein [Rhodococcus sp. NPDC060176]|uniref:recombinase family protein n=1 Tax=Rhodococcus sp. NPDC060176 TaxID=3347062 RepID=UPI00365445B7